MGASRCTPRSADLGVDAGPILSTPRGAPLLPAGARGSISHKESLAVALAARAEVDEGAWRLGIDIERVAPGKLDISKRVLRPEELAFLPPPGDPRRTEELAFAFSAKEAIYKALDPFVARYVSFQEVAVDRKLGWDRVRNVGSPRWKQRCVRGGCPLVSTRRLRHHDGPRFVFLTRGARLPIPSPSRRVRECDLPRRREAG